LAAPFVTDLINPLSIFDIASAVLRSCFGRADFDKLEAGGK